MRFLQQCAAEKDGQEEEEEITDILLEKLVRKGWNVYQSSELLQHYSLQAGAGLTCRHSQLLIKPSQISQ